MVATDEEPHLLIEEVRVPTNAEEMASKEEAMASKEMVVATKVEIVKNVEEETNTMKVNKSKKGSENGSTEPETNQEVKDTMSDAAKDAEKEVKQPENNADEIKVLKNDSQEKKVAEEDGDEQKEKKDVADECGEKAAEEEASAQEVLGGDLPISAGWLARLLGERLGPEYRRGQRYRLADAALPAAVQVVRVEPAVGALTAFTVCDGQSAMDGRELGCFVTRGQVGRDTREKSKIKFKKNILTCPPCRWFRSR